MVELQYADYHIELSHCEDWESWNLHEENLREWLLPIQLQSAREQLTEMGSPQEVQRDNQLAILTWLYRWGYSTADLLSDLLGRANRSHARRLEKNGWLRSVTVRGYPTYFVLTEKGQAEVIHQTEYLIDYKELDPYRVELPKLHHYLVAQAETIAALKDFNYDGYLTERMYAHAFKMDKMPHKQADVILVKCGVSEFQQKTYEFTGIEIELTPKFETKLDQFVTKIIDDIQSGRMHKFLIVTNSNAIMKRYREAFTPGKKVARWQKPKVGKLTDTGEILEIPNWASKHILFREVGSKDPYPTSDLV